MDAKKPNKAIIALIVVALLAGVGGGAFYLTNKNSGDTTTDSTSESTTEDIPSATTDQPADVADADAYKDGTYSATGSYISPGGSESVDVEITLTGDAVTAATVTPHAASGTSVQYQTQFVNNFKALVIGKDIDDIKLSRVAGSSLTSTGFNEAVEQIKIDAAA